MLKLMLGSGDHWSHGITEASSYGFLRSDREYPLAPFGGLLIFVPHQNERAVNVAAILARDEETYR